MLNKVIGRSLCVLCGVTAAIAGAVTLHLCTTFSPEYMFAYGIMNGVMSLMMLAMLLTTAAMCFAVVACMVPAWRDC